MSRSSAWWMPIRACTSRTFAPASAHSSWWRRAGRGARGGRVFVQRRAPDHHAIRAAAAHSVSQFAAAELPLRSPPHPPYPPRAGLVRFVIATEDHARTADLAERVATWLRRAGERVDGALTVLG